MNGVHICSFRGERIPPSRPEYVRDAATGEIFDVQEYPPPMRCDYETSRGRCRKKVSVGVRYAWGCVGLCEKHALEECGPDEGDLGAPEPINPALIPTVFRSRAAWRRGGAR